MVSFFTSQMISGPRNQPQPPTQPVTRPPSSADRCANMAHWRSSAVGTPAGGGGAPAGDEDVGGVTDSGGTLMAVLPQTVVDGPRGDSRPVRGACQAPSTAAENHAAARAGPTRLPSGSAAELPGKTRDSSSDSAIPRCAASTPLNTERKSVVACTSRSWYNSREPMPGHLPATRPPRSAPPARNIAPPVPWSVPPVPLMCAVRPNSVATTTIVRLHMAPTD